MPRLSMNEMTTYRWSFEEDATYYHRAGLAAMGVWRPKLADFGEEKGAELLADLGLGVSNLLWAGGFTGSEGRSYRDSIDDALEAIETAHELQARCLVLYAGGRNNHTLSHARRLFQGALRELAPAARERQVRLAVEPMHPGCGQEWTFLTDVDETLALIDDVDRTQIGLVLDTYHLGHDQALLARLPELVERIAVVHLGDRVGQPQGEQNRLPLSEGELPLGEWIAALSEAGYDGDYDIELMGEEVEPRSYEQLIAQSQQSFARLLQAGRLADSPSAT